MAAEIHPATARMLENFRFDHLPAHLQAVSRPFHDLAHQLAGKFAGPEVTKALDDLWHAKNWGVVAASNSSLEEAPAPAEPEVGDVVLVPVDPVENNGSCEAPAIVTRVWSASTVNVRVLHDGDAVTWRGSLVYREDLDGIEGVPAVWTRKGRA
ncbi:hypothetical protein [Streptomyces fagopyri]